MEEYILHRSSIFNIRIDFEKSHDSYLYDKNRKRYFLDFFGQYSALPLGYNHRIFQEEHFQKTIQKIIGVKVTNCEIISDEARELLQKFSNHKDMKNYEYFHFSCTGALAVEAALKTAMDQKHSSDPKVISLRESFHGINGYGGFVTDRFYPVSKRLDGFPTLKWYQIHNPKVLYSNNTIDTAATEKGFSTFKRELDEVIKKEGGEKIAALLIEPIQATYGDNYFPEDFFVYVREFCDEHHIALVFDEIQTGFGTTGKMWYFQHLPVEPDIVAFGKKAQVSGIMAKKEFDTIFERPIRLEVTFDGDLIDMVRCTTILDAYKKFHLLENAQQRGQQLLKRLQAIDSIQNVRGLGHLLCFDFSSSKEQDAFAQTAFHNGLLFNKTRDVSIRLRPNLNLSSEEVDEGLQIITRSCAKPLVTSTS